MTREFHELSGWRFEVAEVSAGVYRASGTDRAGRTVGLTGTDPDSLLEECKRRAGAIIDQLRKPSSRAGA